MLRFIFKQTNCDDNRADKRETHYTIDIDSPVLQAALTSGGEGPMGFERHELIGVEVLPPNTQVERPGNQVRSDAELGVTQQLEQDMKIEVEVTDEQIEKMVTRFLGWRLPKGFAPDAGISFKPMPDEYMPHCWPTGTNLFDAVQAKEMILHILGNDA